MCSPCTFTSTPFFWWNVFPSERARLQVLLVLLVQHTWFTGIHGRVKDPDATRRAALCYFIVFSDQRSTLPKPHIFHSPFFPQTQAVLRIVAAPAVPSSTPPSAAGAAQLVHRHPWTCEGPRCNAPCRPLLHYSVQRPAKHNFILYSFFYLAPTLYFCATPTSCRQE